ncbi:B12-binding domain-containing radical SAM protein [candidate division KSB1 bacterium]|nr:B12-binding domain-containing radical SAM protein [candidate division KSB1 bacterium]
MNILLVQPPIEDFYTTPIRHYPLNLLYVAHAFQKFGHQVRIFDFLTPLHKRQLPIPGQFRYMKPHIDRYSLLFRHYYRFGRPVKDLLDEISRFKPKMIGVSSQFTAYFSTCVRLIEEIKNFFSVPVFIGGHHATVFKKQIETDWPQIDYIIAGPVESGLKNFMRASGYPVVENSRPIDWKDIVPPHDMLSLDYRIGKKNYISLTALRGCPYRCDFCSVNAMYKDSIEYRTVDSVLSEILINYRRGVRIFNFEDDNLSYRTDWFDALLSAIIDTAELTDIELTAMNGICYWTLNELLVKKMARAGFKSLNLSYITHSSFLRANLHRPRDSKKLEKIIKVAQQKGLFITVYYILGLPEQEYREIKETIDYLFSLDVLVAPSVFYVPAGSPMYEKLSCENIKSNWDFYRSSVFAVETKKLSRQQLIELFIYTREKNLHRRDSGEINIE